MADSRRAALSRHLLQVASDGGDACNRIAGARLITAQETDAGRRWTESRIKAMTGSDPITARFMRQDFFTYTPQFKVIIAGNHKPGLRNVTEAVRRRLHLILRPAGSRSVR